MCTPRFVHFDVTGIAIGRTQVQYILAVNSKRRFRKMAEKGVFIVMAKVPPKKKMPTTGGTTKTICPRR